MLYRVYGNKNISSQIPNGESDSELKNLGKTSWELIKKQYANNDLESIWEAKRNENVAHMKILNGESDWWKTILIGIFKIWMDISWSTSHRK